MPPVKGVVLASKVQRLLVVLAAVVSATATLGIQSPAGATTSLKLTGEGSTYAALAFQTWTEAVQRKGLDVTYTATGSPGGLTAYAQTKVDFAGSEAEFSELYADTTSGTPNGHVPRGFAYAPDVAGASAVMYHVARTATGDDQVTDLRLSRLTVAKIFLGIIKNWDSPTISADNTGLALPNHPINVVYRSGQSGTTALFYDFVNHEDPTQFRAWAVRCGYNPTYRVWQITDCRTGLPFADTTSWSGADQAAQYVAGPSGLWSIGYDENGYTKVYDDNVASIQNASGEWVQPTGIGVTAALQSAVLAPDTSETLNGVYTSANPIAYPISFYSYIIYQCATNPDRPTCKGSYADPGTASLMAQFMLYVACTGQQNMAEIGYAPLPADLSQQLANAAGYATGEPPVHLTAANCASPQFHPTPPTPTPTPPSLSTSSGYDLVGSDGGVFVFPTGSSGGFYGSLPGLGVHVNDVVGMVPTADAQGYFLVGADGGVFSFGNAPFLGSLPGLGIKPAQPITGIVPTGTDGGYFLVGKDGGVYAFGNAGFYGSLPSIGIHTNNVVGIATTPSGDGYWLVSATGGVYAFGAAQYFGSPGATSSPVSAIAGTPTGGGYWIVTQNGSVDAFGNAKYFGSLPGLGVTPAKSVIGVVHTAGTGGYWLIGSDGGIFAFGDAGFVGSLPGLGVDVSDIVGAVPTSG